MQFPDVTGATFQNTVQYLESSILKRTGRTDLRASENLDNRTATEIRTMVGEQNARKRYKELNIDDFVSDIFVKFLMLDQLYLSKERQLRILGAENISRLQEVYGVTPEMVEQDPMMEMQEPKFVATDTQGWLTVAPEDIMGMFDFKVESGSTRAMDIGNRVASIREGIRLLSELGQAFEKDGIRVNFKPLVEDLFSDLGIKNTDKIFEALPPPVQQGGDQMDILTNLIRGGQDGTGGPQQQVVPGGAEAPAGAGEEIINEASPIS